MVKMQPTVPTHLKYTFPTSYLLQNTETQLNFSYVQWGTFQDYILKSKTQTVLLAKQAAILSPSLFQHTSNMPPLPANVLMILPSFNDQMCIDLSRDPLAKYSPFGLKATEYTGSLLIC